MAKFTVIWRDEGDDYMVTNIERENADVQSRFDWVEAAALVEYAHMTEAELDEALDDLEQNGYDLIGVAEGHIVWAE